MRVNVLYSVCKIIAYICLWMRVVVSCDGLMGLYVWGDGLCEYLERILWYVYDADDDIFEMRMMGCIGCRLCYWRNAYFLYILIGCRIGKWSDADWLFVEMHMLRFVWGFDVLTMHLRWIRWLCYDDDDDDFVIMLAQLIEHCINYECSDDAVVTMDIRWWWIWWWWCVRYDYA